MATISIAPGAGARVSDFLSDGGTAVLESLAAFAPDRIVYDGAAEIPTGTGAVTAEWAFSYIALPGTVFAGTPARGFEGTIGALEVAVDTDPAPDRVALGAPVYEVTGLSLALDDFFNAPLAAADIFAGQDEIRTSSGPIDIAAEAITALGPGRDVIAGRAEETGDTVRFEGLVEDFAFTGGAGTLTVTARAGPEPLSVTLEEIDRLVFSDGTVLPLPGPPGTGEGGTGDFLGLGPVAQADAVTVDLSVSSEISAAELLGNDVGFRLDPTGQALLPLGVVNVTGAGVSLAADASAVLLDPQALPSPPPGGTASASFAYTVSDGDPATADAQGTVALTLIGGPPAPQPNEAPVNLLPGSALTTPEDTALALGALGVSDPDAGSGTLTTTLSVTAGTLFTPAGGAGNLTPTLTLTGTLQQINAALSGLVFTPPEDRFGTEILTITTDDGGNTGTGGALSDTDALALGITPVNDPPTARPDTASVGEDGPAVTIDVLTNDGDVEDPGVILDSLDTTATLGTVTRTPDDRVLYDPAGQFETLGPGEQANDSFTYTIRDSGGATDTATVTLTIDGAAEPLPEISIADAAVGEGDPGATPTLDFVVTLSGPAPGPVDFLVSTGPTPGPDTATPDGPGVPEPDFTPLTDVPVQIAAGASQITVSVDVLPDQLAEPDETLAVSLSGIAGAVPTDTDAIGTIEDDDVIAFADTSAADDLTGTAADETITLLADGLADRFDAGGGRDLIDLTALPPGTPGLVDLAGGIVETGPSGTDTLIGFEDVITGDARDRVFGDDLANRIETGDSGSTTIETVTIPSAPRIDLILDDGDLIVDGAGADTLIAGFGDVLVQLSPDATPEAEILAGLGSGSRLATLDFAQATSGVTADLSVEGTSAPLLTGGGLGDQTGSEVLGFRGLAGSDFDDDLAAPNLVFDGPGTDTLRLTPGGDFGQVLLHPDATAESSITGKGTSELILALATGAVFVDLGAQGGALNVISGGGIGNQPGSSVSGFADIFGSAFGDLLLGDGAANEIEGFEGADSIDGREGADTLSGGSGNDQLFAGGGDDFLIGGPGNDDFIVQGNGDDFDVVEDLEAGETVAFNDLNGVASGADSFRRISPLTTLTEIGEGLTVIDDAGGDGIAPSLDPTGLASLFADLGNGTQLTFGAGLSGPTFAAASDGTDTVIARLSNADGLPAIAASEIDPVLLLEGVTSATGLSTATFPDFESGTLAPSALFETDVVDEDGPAITIDLLANDSDPQGFSLELVSLDTSGLQGEVTDNGDGTVTYDPAGQFETLFDGEAAQESFSYTIANSAGLTDTSFAEITIVGADEPRTIIPIDSTDPIAATQNPEVFELRVDNSTGSILGPDFDGQAVINGFDPTEDLVLFTNLSGSDVDAGDILSEDGITISESPLTPSVTFDLDPGPGQSFGADLTVFGVGEVDAENDGVPDFFVVDTLPPPLSGAAVLGGTEGDDRLTGGTGGTIEAGAGRDTVVYDLTRDLLDWRLGPDGGISVTGPGGMTDELIGVERLELADGAVVFDAGSEGASIARLFAAAFGRAPKEAGLLHWSARAEAEPGAVAEAFAASDEFTARIGPAPEPEDFVEALFETVFHRSPDADGLAFWSAAAEALGPSGLLTEFAESDENRAATEADTADGIWVTG